MQSPTFTNTVSFNPLEWFTSGRTEDRAVSPEVRAIADHKWFLSERLRRDVGFPVAALDYRLNIKPKALVAAKTAGPIQAWFLNALERLGEAHGAQTWARLPQSVQVRRVV